MGLLFKISSFVQVLLGLEAPECPCPLEGFPDALSPGGCLLPQHPVLLPELSNSSPRTIFLTSLSPPLDAELFEGRDYLPLIPGDWHRGSTQ